MCHQSVPYVGVHLYRSLKIFDGIRKFGLRLSREKFISFQEKIKFLGHELSPLGVRPDAERVSAIRNRGSKISTGVTPISGDGKLLQEVHAQNIYTLSEPV